MALLTKSDLLAHQSMLLDERTHPHVGKPEVVPGHARAPLLHAAHVEIAAAARAGDGALAGVGTAEPRVVGLEVGVDGPYGDLMGADGTEDGFGHVEYAPAPGW